MRYKSRSSLISQPWFDKIVAETLDMYNRGEDIEKSPFIKSDVAKLHKDCGRKTGEELKECIKERQNKLISLYLSIKDNGYNNKSPLLVSFDNEGRFQLFDGFHRTAVLQYLGLNIDVDLETNWTNMRPSSPLPRGQDFPLVETLLKEYPQGNWLYQPVSDPRLTKFKVHRTDNSQRLDFILGSLVNKTVLEIGCSEGYFSRKLAKRGYQVTAIDKSPGYIAVCRYLATINGLGINYEVAKWQEYLKQDVWFDNILFLSVLHNDMMVDVEDTLKSLSVFQGKTSRVFLEIPNDSPKDWSSEIYDFSKAESIQRIEQEMGMRVRKQWKGYRPMYVLKKEANMQSISPKEWESHNEWERAWWGDCKDTFDEQLKQEIYAEFMKLTQFGSIRHSFNLKKMSILDIGGGPVSLLLRCYDYKRAVIVDPCAYPDWVMERYKIANIEYIKEKAEEVNFEEKFDEVWIYNCLQHVQDPAKVIEMAIKSAKKIRIAEVLEIVVYPGHPQSLTKATLDELFNREGLVEQREGSAHGLFYFGVFRYE